MKKSSYAGFALLAVALAACQPASPPVDELLPAAQRMPVSPTRVIEFEAQQSTLMTLDVSPDGQTIVFDLLGHLYLLPIAGGEARRITQGMFIHWRPRFSPDGRQILFLSNRDGYASLYVADADGGNVRRVYQGERREEARFISPEWMRDGKSIVASFARGQWTLKAGNPDTTTLFQFPLDGGAPTEFAIAKDNGFVVHGESISFTRDGQRAYFVQGRVNGSSIDTTKQVYMLDMQTRQVYPQTMLFEGTSAPHVSPDGRWLVYATRKNGELGYRLRDLTTFEDRWLLFPLDGDLAGWDNDKAASHSAFTPDSRFFVAPLDGRIVKIALPSGEVSDIPFKAKVAVELAPLMKFDYPVEQGPGTARHIQFPRLSQDGKRVVFTAMQRAWVQDLPDGKPRRLVPDLEVGQFAPVWSPDGKRVAFISFDEKAGANIHTVAADGTDLQRVTPDSAASYYATVEYTPDGTQLVYLRGALPGLMKNFLYERENRMEALELRRMPVSGGPSVFLSAVYPPALYYPQANTAGYYWGYSWAWQSVLMSRPHFTNEPDRVYFYDGDVGLVSIGLDGNKRIVHGKVYGDFPVVNDGSEPMPAGEVILSPDGKQALATVGYHVYLIDRDLRKSHDGFRFNVRATPIPQPRGDDAAASASAGGDAKGTAGVRRLSTAGGQYFHWAADGTPYYSYASTLFRTDNSIASRSRPAEIPIDIQFEHDRPRGTLALRGARIITMGRGGVIERGDVLIKDNRIVAVGPSGSLAIPADARSFDVKGKTIIPGLIDTHCHAVADKPVPLRFAQPWEWVNYLAYGVTTCFEVWPPFNDYDDQDLLDAGTMLGPRLYLTPIIEWFDAINSIDDARDLLDRARYYRSNYFKEYIFGDLCEHEFLTHAAHERRLMGVMHSENPTGGFTSVLTNMQLGYPQEAHGYRALHAPRSAAHDDVIQLTAKAGTALQVQMRVVEPLIPYIADAPKHDPRAQRFYPERWLDMRFNTRGRSGGPDTAVINGPSKMYADLAKAGAIVASGDHGEVKGVGTHWGIWEMAAQMPNLTALQIATVNGARSMGLTDLGAIEPGMLADLIVLDRNPLDDIRHSLSIDRVVKNGRVYAGGTLAELWPRQTAAPDFWWLHDDRPAYRPGVSPAEGTGIPEKLRRPWPQ